MLGLQPNQRLIDEKHARLAYCRSADWWALLVAALPSERKGIWSR